jgi:MFS family permease
MLTLGCIAWAVILPAALLLRPAPAAENRPAANLPATTVVRADITVGQALKTSVFWILSLANFACCTAHSGPLFHMVSNAAYCGVKPLTAATVLGAAGLAAMGGRVICGLLADRIGAKRTLVACLVLQAGAIALFSLAHDLDTLYAVSMLFGFSYGGAMPLYAILVREHFPAQIMGSVFGVVALISALGMALGPPVGGLLFDRFGGYGWLYVASSTIGIAAALLALTLRPRRRRPAVLAAAA